jgi:hypothetical protein
VQTAQVYGVAEEVAAFYRVILNVFLMPRQSPSGSDQEQDFTLIRAPASVPGAIPGSKEDRELLKELVEFDTFRL